MKKSLTVLGATGSIGMNTLDLVARHPERYEVFALTAHHDVDKLARLCTEFSPRYAVVAEDEGRYRWLKDRLQGSAAEPLLGLEALAAVAGDERCDVVVAGIVGIAGLRPTLAAAAAGKTILLANKEALVVAGALLMETARVNGARIIPIDSEHNAVFQCTQGGRLPMQKIFLTASGGPFLNWRKEDLAHATPDQACAHPNWKMGRKISVDSATMINKGLEVIEAQWLFSLTARQVEIVVHPQSIVHALVELRDGSVLAQMAQADMRVPIACALAWPERIDSGAEPLDWSLVSALEFRPLDERQFPCTALARQAMAAGSAAVIVLNAANEVAVDAFLNRRLSFTGIASLIASTLQRAPETAVKDLDAVLSIHDAACSIARQVLQNRL